MTTSLKLISTKPWQVCGYITGKRRFWKGNEFYQSGRCNYYYHFKISYRETIGCSKVTLLKGGIKDCLIPETMIDLVLYLHFLPTLKGRRLYGTQTPKGRIVPTTESMAKFVAKPPRESHFLIPRQILTQIFLKNTYVCFNQKISVMRVSSFFR